MEGEESALHNTLQSKELPQCLDVWVWLGSVRTEWYTWWLVQRTGCVSITWYGFQLDFLSLINESYQLVGESHLLPTFPDFPSPEESRSVPEGSPLWCSGKPNAASFFHYWVETKGQVFLLQILQWPGSAQHLEGNKFAMSQLIINSSKRMSKSIEL